MTHEEEGALLACVGALARCIEAAGLGPAVSVVAAEVDVVLDNIVASIDPERLAQMTDFLATITDDLPRSVPDGL